MNENTANGNLDARTDQPATPPPLPVMPPPLPGPFPPPPLPSAVPAQQAAAPRNKRSNVLYWTVAVIAIVGAPIAYFALFHKSAAKRMEAARSSLNNGDFEAAARQLEEIDLPEAKFDLAFLYKNGLGVNQDTLKSVTLMGQAARAGNPLAETTLGLWYVNGDGVAADPAHAAELFYQSAAQGDSNASVLLAMAYATGNGESEDLTQAYEWFTVAALQGNSYAKQQQQQLTAILTDDERARAEQDAQTTYAKFLGGGK